MDRQATATLLTCLGNASDAEKMARLAPVSSEEWGAVAVCARRHGVAPLLHHRLKRLGVALPDDVADELQQAYRQNARWNALLYAELGKLLRLLQEQDIPVIALKGAHLAAVVYENIGLRTLADIDLLVKQSDLMRIDKALLALGYEPRDLNRVVGQDNWHFHYTLVEMGLGIEAHWTLLAPKHSLPLNVDGLWARAQPAMLGNVSTLALALEDLVPYLCLHTVDHIRAIEIRRLCDLDEIVRRYGNAVDWEAIGARARQSGMARATYVILQLARELLGAAVPADWLASLRPAGFEERYLTLARAQVFGGDAVQVDWLQSQPVAQLWGPKGLGSKLRILRERLLLSHETMALKYPAPANSWRIYLYYPVRFKDVLMQHGKSLWRLARGDPQTRAAATYDNQIASLREWLMSV